ncbi:MAG: hypothetical protein WA821_15910 [Anaerolineales bacterium]
MRESELNVEYIQSAAAYTEATPRVPEPFEVEMEVLCNRLERLHDILTHVDQYAFEEFVGVFTQASGKFCGYHRFVHDESNKEV